MKYRKKPIEIEAVRWEGTTDSWVEIMAMGKINWKPGEMGSETFYIETKEGLMKVSNGDYVIKEPFDTERGFYPCKPEIFEQTYEPADA